MRIPLHTAESASIFPRLSFSINYFKWTKLSGEKMANEKHFYPQNQGLEIPVPGTKPFQRS